MLGMPKVWVKNQLDKSMEQEATKGCLMQRDRCKPWLGPHWAQPARSWSDAEEHHSVDALSLHVFPTRLKATTIRSRTPGTANLQRDLGRTCYASCSHSSLFQVSLPELFLIGARCSEAKPLASNPSLQAGAAHLPTTPGPAPWVLSKFAQHHPTSALPTTLLPTREPGFRTAPWEVWGNLCHKYLG